MAAIRARRLLGLVAFLAALVAITRPAAAQDRPSIDARTWRPSTDPNASIAMEPAVTPGPGVLTVGAWGHYDLRPLSLGQPDGTTLHPLEHVLGVDPIVSLGIGQRLALGATLPVLLYQTGDSPLSKAVSDVAETPHTAIGDLGLSLKGALVRNEQGGFGLAALGNVSLPTGSRESFAGEGAPTVTARLLAEFTLLIAVAQASVGYKLRVDHRTWPAPEAGGVRFGDEIPWSFALGMRPGMLGIDPGNRQRIDLALHGSLPAGPVGPFGSGDPGSASLSPILLGLSDRIELGHYRDAFVTVGAELGLTQAVGAPLVRAIVGIGWTPRAHDLDGDGVKDDVDGCPEIPEDKDGFEDADGCPEIDNDNDGIIDKEDACPNVAGSPSRDRSKNGCPMPDADGDGVPDAEDACPAEKGVRSADPKLNGCPGKDSDGDGIPDGADKCPNAPEDKDGFQDADGCPDPDNDGDGIPDASDACPNEPGPPSSDPARNGCPSHDRDGDTFDNDVDKCPDEAEVFNGVDDEDGCPDTGGKPLVTIDDKRRIRLAKPLTIGGTRELPEVDPASKPTLRALALELNRHRDWTLAIGARPGAGADAQLDALARSFAVVRALSELSQRDGLAETIGWDAVRNQPQAETGLAFVVLTNALPPSPAPAPTPAPSTTAPTAAPPPLPAPHP